MTPGQASERSGDWGAEVFKCPECRSLEAQIAELREALGECGRRLQGMLDELEWNREETEPEWAAVYKARALSTDQPTKP